MAKVLYETWHRRYLDAGASGPRHGWVVHKPLVEQGVCVEIAIRDEIAAAPDWDAVWVRNAVGGGAGFLRFWRTMPPDLSDRSAGDVEIPAWPTSVLDNIKPDWRRGGVLDVFAWNETTREVRFVEAKRRGRDHLRPGQLSFIQAGLRAGWPPRCFVVVEWDFVNVDRSRP